MKNIEKIALLVIGTSAVGYSAPVGISSYSYVSNPAKGSAPRSNFPDTGMVELNDNIIATTGSFSETSYAGFQSGEGTDLVNGQPSIIFELDSLYSLSDLTVHYLAQENADLGPRDGTATTSAGRPGTNVFDDHVEVSFSSDGFTFDTATRYDPYPQGDVVTNAAASFMIDLGGVDASFVRLDFYRDHNAAGAGWLFLSEVDFRAELAAVPEPSSSLALAGLLALGIFGRRRR